MTIYNTISISNILIQLIRMGFYEPRHAGPDPEMLLPGRGGGGGALKAEVNRMEERAHFGHLSYCPALELPPPFPSFVWNGTAVFYSP